MKKHHHHKKTTHWYPKVLTILFLLLGAAIILFPIQKTPMLAQVQFVWNAQQIQGVHGSASDQRDYLFNDTSTGTTTNPSSSEIIGTNLQISGSAYTGTLYTGQLVITGTLPTTGTVVTMTGTVPTTGISSEILGQNPPTPALGKPESSLLQAMQQSIDQMLGITVTIAQPTQTGTQQIFKDCTTPRGATVQNQDFVLAYQQRSDVNTICNVERRSCNDGVLEGSYTGDSCKEDVTYTYQKAQVVSYNQQIINPLVQPGPASNASGSFSTQGKLNETLQPATVAGTTNQPVISNAPTVNQGQVTKKNCISPRGTIIQHGQFVKAYKSSIGLIDLPCETELRLCINGTLKGSFVNKACVFKNMTFNDYIAGNTDITSPTPQDLQQTLINVSNANTATDNNNGIFDRVTSFFKK